MGAYNRIVVFAIFRNVVCPDCWTSPSNQEADCSSWLQVTSSASQGFCPLSAWVEPPNSRIKIVTTSSIIIIYSDIFWWTYDEHMMNIVLHHAESCTTLWMFVPSQGRLYQNFRGTLLSRSESIRRRILSQSSANRVWLKHREMVERCWKVEIGFQEPGMLIFLASATS